MNLRDVFVLETGVEYASSKNVIFITKYFMSWLTYALHVGSPAIDKWLPSYRWIICIWYLHVVVSDLKGLLSHSNEWQIGPLNLDMTIGFT